MRAIIVALFFCQAFTAFSSTTEDNLPEEISASFYEDCESRFGLRGGRVVINTSSLTYEIDATTCFDYFKRERGIVEIDGNKISMKITEDASGYFNRNLPPQWKAIDPPQPTGYFLRDDGKLVEHDEDGTERDTYYIRTR